MKQSKAISITWLHPTYFKKAVQMNAGGVFETVGGTKGASGMTPDEEIDFICERFEAADCEVALETCTIGLNIDIADRQPYTLLPGALDRMRGVYKRRLAELREGK